MQGRLLWTAREAAVVPQGWLPGSCMTVCSTLQLQGCACKLIAVLGQSRRMQQD